MTRLKRRLENLEQETGESGPIGVQRPSGEVKAEGESMTLEEFRKRYPSGQLIRIRYTDPPGGMPESAL